MILLKFFYCFIAVIVASFWITFLIAKRISGIIGFITALTFILFAIFSFVIGLMFL